ncbi:hypothetical protein FQZ97_1183820 [compost metagenome]
MRCTTSRTSPFLGESLVASSGWPIRMMEISLLNPDSSWSRMRLRCLRVAIGMLCASSMISTWRKPAACDFFRVWCTWAKRASGLFLGLSSGDTAAMIASAIWVDFRVLPLMSLSSMPRT